MADDLSSKHQFLVSIAGVTGFFTSMSAVETTAQIKEVWDGGADTSEILAGKATHGTATTRRPWRRYRDLTVLGQLRPQVGAFWTTITKQPTDAAGRADGGAITYRALLTGITDPETMNGQETDEPELVLTWKVQKIT